MLDRIAIMSVTIGILSATLSCKARHSFDPTDAEGSGSFVQSLVVVPGSGVDDSWVRGVEERYLQAGANPSARAAVELKRAADAANQQDVARLVQGIQGWNMPPAELSNQLMESLRTDKAKLQDVAKNFADLAFKERVTTIARSAVGKLTGSAPFTGLLDDAGQMFKERGAAFLAGNKDGWIPRHNQISVAKTLLIYLNLLRNGQSIERMPDSIEFLYPEKLLWGDRAVLKDFRLGRMDGDSFTLFIPNAGYVYGGDFVADRHRGTDCSSFISRATRSSVRLSTMVMEYTWRELQGDHFASDDPEGKTRGDFKANWGMSAAMNEYQAVGPKDGNMPGDLVVWRWINPANGKAARHTVMFLEADAADPGVFVGIENNREDDKTVEGILIRKYRMNVPDVTAFVLRRR